MRIAPGLGVALGIGIGFGVDVAVAEPPTGAAVIGQRTTGEVWQKHVSEILVATVTNTSHKQLLKGNGVTGESWWPLTRK